MGLPPPLEAVGPQQQQLVWPAGPSNMEDDGQQQDTSSVALLKEVAILSDQSPGVQATASLHIISPGAAAGDEAQTKPVGRLLALHRLAAENWLWILTPLHWPDNVTLYIALC